MGRIRALWWWIDRWRKSTAYTGMTLEEQGAYRNLLDEGCLRGGPLPDDDEVLAKACGDPRRWRKVRPKVMGHFVKAPDGWRNETLDKVLKESERRATNQANYRQRHDNKPDNAHDNGTDNGTGHRADNEAGNAADNNHDNKADSPSPSPVSSAPSEPQRKRERETRARRTGPKTGLLKPNGHVAFETPRVFMPWDVYHKLLKLRNGSHPELEMLFEKVAREWGPGGVHEHDETGANQFRFWDARYEEFWPPTVTAKPPTSHLPQWAQDAKARKAQQP